MVQMKDKQVTRESDKFMLRLPDGMRDKIAEAAKNNGRSMNAELVARLQESFMDLPRMTEAIDRELGTLQTVVTVFKATSADFQKELGDRMSQYLDTLPESPIVVASNDKLREALGLPKKESGE